MGTSSYMGITTFIANLKSEQLTTLLLFTNTYYLLT